MKPSIKFIIGLLMCGPVATAWGLDRASGGEKGSLLIFPLVEMRWDAQGELIQDTFLNINNDYPGSLYVQMFFVNADPPRPAVVVNGVVVERAHFGYNNVGAGIELTANQAHYWSAVSGGTDSQEVYVQPWTVLDPGSPPGRPAGDGSGERVLRGFLVAFASDVLGQEIRWNHLQGSADIIDYDAGTAWEYHAWTLAAEGTHGQQTPGLPGELRLDGTEYDTCFSELVLDFIAGGAQLAGDLPVAVVVEDTLLTLLPMAEVDLSEGGGRRITKADFNIWNMNEQKLSGSYRCVDFWDSTLLSQYGVPNQFSRSVLGTDKGKARIAGLGVSTCPGSVASPLLAVAAKRLAFGTGGDLAWAGSSLTGTGSQAGLIRTEYITVPDEMRRPPGRQFGVSNGGLGLGEIQDNSLYGEDEPDTIPPE